MRRISTFAVTLASVGMSLAAQTWVQVARPANALLNAIVFDGSALPAQPGLVYAAHGFGTASWNGAALPVDLGAFALPGCLLWIAAEPAGLLLAHSGSTLSWQIGLPNVPALAGTTLTLQALVLDAAAPNGAASVTNAGIATLR